MSGLFSKLRNRVRSSDGSKKYTGIDLSERERMKSAQDPLDPERRRRSGGRKLGGVRSPMGDML